ncbi:MAG TPA: hypothetical protein VKB73_05175 [Gaiellaceae bacterium]|nr:hypothetical protein [Gaiellaceae bacterium]
MKRSAVVAVTARLGQRSASIGRPIKALSTCPREPAGCHELDYVVTRVRPR